MHENSLRARNNILKSGGLNRQQLDIVSAMRLLMRKTKRPYFTVSEIAQAMGTDWHKISGRFRVMGDAGILEEMAEKYSYVANDRTYHCAYYRLVKSELENHCPVEEG